MTTVPGARNAVRRVVLLTVLVLLAAAASGAERVMLKIGDPPPAFSLPDLDGRTVNVPGDLRGKAVIVHFWADWCQFCLEEMPALDALYQQYREKGLVIVAVNVGQPADAARAYVKRVRITYPVVLDQESRTAKQYGVLGLPRTFFLDRKGLIRYQLLGEASPDTLRKLALNTPN